MMMMDEWAWQDCADPYEMLDLLTASPSYLTVQWQRKLQLLCCACCRRLGRHLSRTQMACIESAEGDADLWLAANWVDRPFSFQRWGPHGTTVTSILAAAVREACENRGTSLCYAASVMALRTVPPDLTWRTEEFRAARSAEVTVQAALVRDLFGNPLWTPPPVDEAWLSWNHGIVRRLGRRIYEEGEFGRLPILADALEDAGCTEAEVLDHCRGPGPHARGCWVLDWVRSVS
jgi:hypothetical protein